MALIIRAPLDMADGHKVRSLEDLREYFNLEKVLESYYNGRLLKWLEGLGLEDELDAVRALDDKAPDFASQICEIFQVPYTGAQVDLEVVQERLARLNRLKRITDETEHHRNIDLVAFCQEELAKLVLEDGETTVYLCQEEGENFTFTIPSSCKGVTYYGIPCQGKLPQVRVTRKAWDKLDELDIHIHSCDLKQPASEQEMVKEPQGIREEPVQQFFQELRQKKSCGPNQDYSVSLSVFTPGPVETSASYQGTAEQLKEKAVELVQKAAAGNGGSEDETGFVAGLQISSGDLNCQLRMCPDFSARAQVKGVHIERDADGGRVVYVDLLHAVKLNGRKYHSIQILTSKIYQALNLLEGSEVEVFCLGDLPPAIRVYERGHGRTLRCPHCGSKFMVRDDRVFCENPVCADRLHGRIYRFLNKLELPYDKSFVQKMITELPIKSIKDLFQIDNAMLEQYRLDDKVYGDFPEKLRKAVSNASADCVLGGMGIPGLNTQNARAIIRNLFAKKIDDIWGAIVQSLDRLDEKPFETTVPYDLGTTIQQWLRCDPRTAKTFRDDIAAIQKIPGVENNVTVSIYKSLQSLGRGSTVGFSGFRNTEIVHLAKEGGRNFTYINDSRWAKDHFVKFEAVVIPAESHVSEMVSYAQKNGIPIFTRKTFLAAFPDNE